MARLRTAFCYSLLSSSFAILQMARARNKTGAQGLSRRLESNRLQDGTYRTYCGTPRFLCGIPDTIASRLPRGTTPGTLLPSLIVWCVPVSSTYPCPLLSVGPHVHLAFLLLSTRRCYDPRRIDPLSQASRRAFLTDVRTSS